ncbi:hypothetical protein [Roseiconus lacunae]|uniref:Uncharacterized protein n=1 Tax=Roseiconus lacunae TaxID=2605694 RepID=A0ABT7PLP5_9BACT|nr:hypothetical protein [Roseiconus lacunae]MCD0460851.1 hypothetical protein [Roseiconus lacunae]MDM4017395.1 hypothetical protein [Roseiconus lacunae]WRQ48695.1 hypothetical protein U8335_17200 [Stieleria sp. HD01]
MERDSPPPSRSTTVGEEPAPPVQASSPDPEVIATQQVAENSAVADSGGDGPPVQAVAPELILGDLKRQMNRLQREIRLTIQAQLGQMAGRSLGSIEANRELVRSIQEMLDAHGLRVRCTQCGQPAILRVSPRSGASAGVFVFDHTVGGRRTFHGGRVVMPEIRLVAKPPRKSRSA